MEKLLTVSVAAYNGAATLQKALESCLVADESLQALLDVIIIDDGSTDGTAALAQAFVQAHPGSFRLVSKVNGGYGSTLNTAVELASGRYFRTLDCDDWFDTNALQTLLRRLQNCTADAVYTNYRTVQENGSGKASAPKLCAPHGAPCRSIAATRIWAIRLLAWLRRKPSALCRWFCTSTAWGGMARA